MTTRKATPDIMADLMSAAPAGAAKPAAEPKLIALIPLAKVRSDGGTQMRAALNEDTLAEYQEKFNSSHAWGDFPPVVLFYDGRDYWVGDGFHRVEAYRRAVGGNPNTTIVHADLRAGSRRDAILYAAGANAAHGLRRTQADKRRSVETLLRDAEWSAWSDREIARQCKVSADLVGTVRKQVVTVGIDSERTYTTKHGTPAVMRTTNIGTSLEARLARAERANTDAAEDAWQPAQEVSAPPKWAAIWELEGHVRDCAKQFYAEETSDHATQDMRANARVCYGGFWERCERTMQQGTASWRQKDLAQAINNVASQIEAKPKPPIGKPMIEVLRTADELAAEAEAADIASRNAAADEAERQAREVPDFVAETRRQIDAFAAATTDAAFGVTRHTHLLHVLQQAAEALPEIGDLIHQRQFCLSVVVTLETMQKELLRKMAEVQKAPAPPPAAAATELPADLVAHGWTLEQRRGKWYASVAVETEDAPIETIGRVDLSAAIADAVFMHKNLRIGAPA